jgi:hypothetical protein
MRAPKIDPRKTPSQPPRQNNSFALQTLGEFAAIFSKIVIHTVVMNVESDPAALDRAASARINGSKSRGPITESGRLISSQNRIRHGLLARTIVLKGESYSRFSTLLNGLRAQLLPEGPVETALVNTALVNTVAACTWRRMRLWSLEKASITLEADNTPAIDNPPTQIALAWRNLSDSGRSLELFSRYESRLDAQYDRALRRLEAIQKAAIQKRKQQTNPGSR